MSPNKMVAVMLCCWAQVAHAEEGEVRVPLATFQELSEAVRASQEASAPSRYAIGTSQMSVSVRSVGDSATARVEVRFDVRVLEDRWTLVPVLPGGVAVTQASVNGSATQLSPTPNGLAWASKSSGKYTLQINYEVDARRSGKGMVLPLSLPAAQATRLEATIPGPDLEVAVIPSAGAQTQTSGNNTRVTASLPNTSAVQVSWRTPSRQGFAINRASYKGKLEGNAVAWTAELDVDLFSGETQVPLLPSGVTLSALAIDGKPSTIVTANGRFAPMVKGRGRHRIKVSFEVPVRREGGPPRIDLSIPQIPISRFDLRLPGKKEVSVNPAANVRTRMEGNTTVATINAPMTSALSMTWSEAIPTDIKEDVRANAQIYHAAHAEEGVLHGRAIISYEVTRGETNLIELVVPNDIQVNRIADPSGAVSDWRVSKSPQGKKSRVSVFLDRKVKGEFRFEVRYERLIGTGPNAPDIMSVPLLSMVNVHRQRGMVALLTSSEFSLKPVEEKLVSKVGENQIPSFVREQLKRTVAHTYKYIVDNAKLAVQAVPPERKLAKFDAEVDTLISLSDVTMKGSATVRVNVKSGKMEVLQLVLPEQVTLLNLTAPSKRTHTVKEESGKQFLDIHFTQEMEGEFRVDLDYERIMASDQDAEASVPTVKVTGAEPEQGRIAVEALTAVEVQASTVENLSLLDANALPQQLRLKTRNPIRLAYKYIQADPPYRLGLKITRHRGLETQVATIENANYRTLFTRDGLAVTVAKFTVRNSRKQFLKVCLPEESEVWSVFVANKEEKPALATKTEGSEETCEGLNVLIKIINSSQGFPVEMVFKSKVSKIRTMGTVEAQLPRPEMIVTNTRWDVYLPDKLSYRDADSNMDLVVEGQPVPREQMAQELAEGATRVPVPMAGIQYSFEKLYANQGDAPASFSIPYASVGGEGVATLIAVLGTLLFWTGLFLLVLRTKVLPTNVTGGGTVLGLLLTVVAFYLGASSGGVIVPSVLALLTFGGLFALLRLGGFRKKKET